MCQKMKTLITITAFLIFVVQSSAQRQISYGYTQISKTAYNSCNRVSSLVLNPQIKKQSGKLVIPLTGKHNKVFNDSKSDEEFKEYGYLGDIKGTMLSLVKLTDYNSEAFFLINRRTGVIDTLIGQPFFAQNLKDFACINNPGTDEKQRVQVCEIKNGSVETRVYLKGKPDTFLEDITCIRRNSLLAKDNNGEYWKLTFKIGNE